ncbi:hypothetical protein FJY71_00065 [candidate division WOR-3 bacterium]|nr:hypothetical protein [candidate division WOR-3 bacterium]
MKSRLLLPVLLLVALRPKLAPARVVQVPEGQATIQRGINDANNGDTVSVWGPPPGQRPEPPWTYPENVDFLGKSIYVVNRSFLEPTGYDSSWDWVVIDGQQNGPTVTMTLLGQPPPVPRATLEGFTVTGGRSDCGGGIYCEDAELVLERNRVADCAAVAWGGGICYLNLDPSHAETVFVRGCLVEENAAEYGDGGGVYVSSPVWGSYAVILLRGNEIRYNTARYYGGGVYLSQNPGQPPFPPTDTILEGNVIRDNCAEFGMGGGICSFDVLAGWVMRNQFTGNTPDGICQFTALPGFSTPLWLGDAMHPGFNVLMENGQYDYRLVGNFAALPQWAVGNYWGTLDSEAIWNRISGVYQCHFCCDPIAASGKWFSVNQNSLCQYGIIVTGDLVVDPGRVLTIGRDYEDLTLRFSWPPDYSAPGGDPGLCDLIVSPGGTLAALGGQDQRIWFKPGAAMTPVGWGGLRLMPGSHADIRKCCITGAFVGVEAQTGATVHVLTSRIDSCAFAGVRSRRAAVSLIQDTIANNGVSGVEVDMTDSPLPVDILDNVVGDNGFAGIRAMGAGNGGPYSIVHNSVVSSAAVTAAPFGVRLEQNGASLMLRGNRVTGFHSAGVLMENSSPLSQNDTLVGNSAHNLQCLSSSPVVRDAVVDASQVGVVADQTSWPDLGTYEHLGNNSILMDNVIWVRCTRDNTDSVHARGNWWGTENPLAYPEKFVGPVAIWPWRLVPPDGGQSGGNADMPLRTELTSCGPNPFRTTAVIHYALARAGQMRLRIHDVTGREATTLVSGVQEPGRYSVAWNGTDDRGRKLSRGVYFCRLIAEGCTEVEKLVLTR